MEWDGAILRIKVLIGRTGCVIVKVKWLEQVEYPVVVEGDFCLLYINELLGYYTILKDFGLVVARVKNFVVFNIGWGIEKLMRNLGPNQHILNICRILKRLTVLVFCNVLQLVACIDDDCKRGEIDCCPRTCVTLKSYEFSFDIGAEEILQCLFKLWNINNTWT
jgi:hypothetical protein